MGKREHYFQYGGGDMYKGVLKSSLPDQEETKNRFMMFGQILRSELRKKKKILQHLFIYLLSNSDRSIFSSICKFYLYLNDGC